MLRGIFVCNYIGVTSPVGKPDDYSISNIVLAIHGRARVRKIRNIRIIRSHCSFYSHGGGVYNCKCLGVSDQIQCEIFSLA